MMTTIQNKTTTRTSSLIPKIIISCKKFTMTIRTIPFPNITRFQSHNSLSSYTDYISQKIKIAVLVFSLQIWFVYCKQKKNNIKHEKKTNKNKNKKRGKKKKQQTQNVLGASFSSPIEVL